MSVNQGYFNKVVHPAMPIIVLRNGLMTVKLITSKIGQQTVLTSNPIEIILSVVVVMVVMYQSYCCSAKSVWSDCQCT